MSAVPSWFKPLKQIVDAIFRHDLVLRRDASGVRVVLSDRARVAAPGRKRPAEEAAAKQRQELALMRSQLATVLDELPQTRHTLQHLAFVDQALGKEGLCALDKLPPGLMRHALDQFEGLVSNWSPVGLASLRAKMAVALIRRGPSGPDEGPGADRTSALHGTGLPRDAAGVVALERADEEALAAAYAAYATVGGPTVPSTEVLLHGKPDLPSARAARTPEAEAEAEAASPEATGARHLQA